MTQIVQKDQVIKAFQDYKAALDSARESFLATVKHIKSKAIEEAHNNHKKQEEQVLSDIEAEIEAL